MPEEIGEANNLAPIVVGEVMPAWCCGKRRRNLHSFAPAQKGGGASVQSGQALQLSITYCSLACFHRGDLLLGDLQTLRHISWGEADILAGLAQIRAQLGHHTHGLPFLTFLFAMVSRYKGTVPQGSYAVS
jgi:hypothetical protein